MVTKTAVKNPIYMPKVVRPVFNVVEKVALVALGLLFIWYLAQ